MPGRAFERDCVFRYCSDLYLWGDICPTQRDSPVDVALPVARVVYKTTGTVVEKSCAAGDSPGLALLPSHQLDLQASVALVSLTVDLAEIDFGRSAFRRSFAWVLENGCRGRS